MKLFSGQIPFDAKGGLLHHPSDFSGHLPVDAAGNFQYGRRPPDWRDNEVFEDTLEFVGYSRGRSAAVINLVNSRGESLHMFMTDFSKFVLNRGFVDGKFLTGRFAYCKRGQNYGLISVDALEAE